MVVVNKISNDDIQSSISPVGLSRVNIIGSKPHQCSRALQRTPKMGGMAWDVTLAGSNHDRVGVGRHGSDILVYGQGMENHVPTQACTSTIYPLFRIQIKLSRNCELRVKSSWTFQQSILAGTKADFNAWAAFLVPGIP